MEPDLSFEAYKIGGGGGLWYVMHKRHGEWSNISTHDSAEEAIDFLHKLHGDAADDKQSQI